MARQAKFLRDRFGLTTRRVEANILKDRAQTIDQRHHNERIIRKSCQKAALRLAAERSRPGPPRPPGESP